MPAAASESDLAEAFTSAFFASSSIVTRAPMRIPAAVFWMPSSSLMFLMFTTRFGV